MLSYGHYWKTLTEFHKAPDLELVLLPGSLAAVNLLEEKQIWHRLPSQVKAKTDHKCFSVVGL